MEIWNDESNALASSTSALRDKWIIAKGRFEALSVATTEGFGWNIQGADHFQECKKGIIKQEKIPKMQIIITR